MLTDPETGIDVFEPEEIKRVSLRYCVKLLTNRAPKEQYSQQFALKESLHWLRMQEVIENDINELSLDMFNKTLRSVSRKKADKYKFILKAGQSLINAIFNIFNSVWKSEYIPKDWHRSDLVQLWKGKGSVSDLNNIRHLHVKCDLAKLFCQIVMSQAKDTLVNNMSKYQIATKPGHRASEHLFFIKSIVALTQARKEAVLVTMWDIQRFFDSESLIDCLSELYKSQIKGKLYRLIFRLNENIKITVKTPVGDSDSEDTGKNVGQGTSDGAIISAVNLDNGVKDAFDDVTLIAGDGEIDEVNIETGYKDSNHPVLFQDDIAKVSKTIDEAQRANDKLLDMMESKGLDFNLIKSCVIVMGEKKARKKLLDNLSETPLILNGVNMKISDGEKYLGEILTESLSGSVHETVKKRVGMANLSVFEIKAVVDDARAEAVGRLTVGFTIWETAVIPSLLHGAEVWTEISKKTLKMLEKIQLKYLRLVTGVGTGCPKPILYYHTGTLSMSYRIVLRKILFLHHVATLPLGSLARDTYETMREHNHRGLVSECEPILQEFNIHNIQAYSKHIFKKLVKAKILNKYKSELLEAATKYKKITPELLSKDEFGVNSYFKMLTVSQSRLRFRLYARMTPRVAMCHKSDKRYREIGYQCVACREAGEPVSQETQDTEEHLITCRFYSDLREDIDLETDLGIVKYFQRVISRRTETEKYVEDNVD